MKQLIVLCAMIILGIVMIECILGDNGILSSMKVLWSSELDMKNMQIVGP